MRQLALLRHAKSDDPSGADDHDRTLATRGEKDATAVGRVIQDQLGQPDLVLVSTAVRAQLTWQLAATAWAQPPRTLDEPRIYEASVQSLLGVLHELDEHLSSVVLVGHNPGVASLAATLVADASDQDARDRLERKYPTCALAVFEFDEPWGRLSPGSATLRSFTTP